MIVLDRLAYAVDAQQVLQALHIRTQEDFASCQLCPREACPSRRMPYEPEVFERRYAGG